MKAMRKSKCVYCVTGIDLTTAIGEFFAKMTVCNLCEIDKWDEDVRCRKGYCKYYRRKKESEVK
jgi:hypothetical protein